MPDLPPYDPKSTCSKCGHWAVSSQHARFTHPWCMTTYDEAIRRQCCRCGFTWDEAVLDGGSDPMLKLARLEGNPAGRR